VHPVLAAASILRPSLSAWPNSDENYLANAPDIQIGSLTPGDYPVRHDQKATTHRRLDRCASVDAPEGEADNRKSKATKGKEAVDWVRRSEVNSREEHAAATLVGKLSNASHVSTGAQSMAILLGLLTSGGACAESIPLIHIHGIFLVPVVSKCPSLSFLSRTKSWSLSSPVRSVTSLKSPTATALTTSASPAGSTENDISRYTKSSGPTTMASTPGARAPPTASNVGNLFSAKRAKVAKPGNFFPIAPTRSLLCYSGSFILRRRDLSLESDRRVFRKGSVLMNTRFVSWLLYARFSH
jgi:hypothetical protein